MRTIMTYEQEIDVERKSQKRPWVTYGAIGLGTIYALGLGVVATVAMLLMPSYDAHVHPVLTEQVVTNVTYTHEDKRLCWSWQFSKIEEAKASGIGFQVRDRDGDIAPLVPYRADTGNPFDARAPTRKPGRHRIPLCAIMPEGIESPWVVTGYIDYETVRPWPTRAYSPPIVPAEGKTTPGDNG